MKHKIFVSQATLGQSRNRPHRILEAIIDKHKIPKDKTKINCLHYEYCNTRKFGRINCLTKSTMENCQTYKFFERYGKDYNEMFI